MKITDMGGSAGGRVLVGRQVEQQQLVELCDRARAGESGVLVIHGEAGMGKTALLASVLGEADGLRTIRISGAESE
ncbi:MAG: ATP-binding protein, partial [Mycobacterium sp.]